MIISRDIHAEIKDVFPSLGQRFSLHWAKESVNGFDELLTEKAQELVRVGRAARTLSDLLGDGAVLYSFPGFRDVPTWAKQLQPAFVIPGNIFSESACGILAFKKGGHIFALSLAHGHVYLNDAKTTADFGLRVAINAISDEKIRSIERANIGAAIRDFAQAAGQRELRAFGFDDALDLIRKVSGQAADSNFARNLTGAKALRFSREVEITDLPQVAIEAVQFYKSEAYQDTAFKIIDFLSPVADETVAEELDEALVYIIRERGDEFEISVPEIFSENVGSFRFERAGYSKFHPDLSLELYQESLGDDLSTLSLEDLKSHSICAYAEDGDRPIRRWSIYEGLVGSLQLDGSRYVINEGLWYSVETAFKQAADSKFEELRRPPDRKLRPLRKIIQEEGRKRKAYFQSEKSYNAEMAAEAGYLLLDARLIKLDEKPGSGIEACDLLDIRGKRFIHIKKSSRQSSILSHFFKQGGNSARMLRKYPKFKQNLVSRVRADYGRAKALELEEALDSGKWTVEFQIADFPRVDGTHNIPFFSKLTLREEALDLEAMGFKVRVGFITLTRAV